MWWAIFIGKHRKNLDRAKHEHWAGHFPQRGIPQWQIFGTFRMKYFCIWMRLKGQQWQSDNITNSLPFILFGWNCNGKTLLVKCGIYPTHHLPKRHLPSGFGFAINPRVNCVLHDWLLWINEPEGGDIRATVLEFIQMHHVQVQGCDEVAVIVAHHANLLSLLQYLVDFVCAAVQNNVGLCGILDLLQKWSIVTGITQLTHSDRKFIGSMGFEEFLQTYQSLIGFIDDGKALPAPGTDNVHESLGEHTGMRIEINEATLTAQSIVPAGFEMGYLHGVTDTLNVTGSVGGLWPKNCCHSCSQQVANSFAGMEAVQRIYLLNLCRQFRTRQDRTISIYFLNGIAKGHLLGVITRMEKSSYYQPSGKDEKKMRGWDDLSHILPSTLSSFLIAWQVSGFTGYPFTVPSWTQSMRRKAWVSCFSSFAEGWKFHRKRNFPTW